MVIFGDNGYITHRAATNKLLDLCKTIVSPVEFLQKYVKRLICNQYDALHLKTILFRITIHVFLNSR